MPGTRSQTAKSGRTQRNPAASPPTKKTGEGKKKKPDSTIEDGTITDPVLVKHPYIELVHENLSRAWLINRYNSMPFIFDAVSPARIFLPGRLWSEGEPFVPYTKQWIGKSSEEDPDGTLMQFEAKPYR